MRSLFLSMCAAILLVGSGCGLSFQGEWLEDGVVSADGTVLPLKDNTRRMAIEFSMPWAVRYGTYVDSIRKVDNLSVQASVYVPFDGERVAQFGSMLARREGDQLTVIVEDQGELRHFTRVHGNAIFPPMVQWPDIAMGAPAPTPQQYAMLLDRLDELTRAQTLGV
jgi:hypothetical protein